LYVVFSNTQIKSINNTGSFDANNPDIRFRDSGLKQPKADKTNPVFNITAKDLIEVKTTNEIQHKLESIFGKYNDLDKMMKAK
jgi:hypothetical protein